MKTVTYEQFLTFKPCWLETEQGRKRLKRYAKKREKWTALDVLALNRVPAKDRLWAVLREEFIDAPILHEFACRCAERALSRVETPDPRSVAAIAAKRAWLRGEIGDDELAAAGDAARTAADDAAAWAARTDAARAAWAAADDADWAAADAAAWDAWAAALTAADADAAERQWQIEELRRMLEQEVEHEKN